MLLSLVGGPGVLSLQKDCSGFAGFGRRLGQAALEEEESIFSHPHKPPTKQGFIMGYGGYLTLVNGSPFDWVTSSTPSYQMDTWNWPTVSAGKVFDLIASRQDTDKVQAKPQRCMSSLVRKVRQRTMQARLTSTSPVHRISSPCWLGNPPITSLQSLWTIFPRSKVHSGRKWIWAFDTMRL
jgi:hypothetical protein